MDDQMSNGNLKSTALNNLQLELGAKMVPFAGYEMPVNFRLGVLGEHNHTRAQAGLFDVSHMGQFRLYGRGKARALESLVPADVESLELGAMRYSQFTNDRGGIIDDLIITNVGDYLYLVVNGANKLQDLAHIEANLPTSIVIEHRTHDALLALQGPSAGNIMARLAPDSEKLLFMTGKQAVIGGVECQVSRAGYTGGDGFEISMAEEHAETVARLLLAEEEVAPIGLGARDTLRLEAGLCLHGHDINVDTTPVEAGLLWSIQNRRREEGGFLGDDVIQKQIRHGVSRKRVGILPEGRAPAREGTDLIGQITSGGFGPTVGCPIAKGYVSTRYIKIGTRLGLQVRGRTLPARVVGLPFVPASYFRG